jgi:hypothetical protein
MPEPSSVVGYSSNDFYYTNPEYCQKTTNGYQRYNPTTGKFEGIGITENTYTSGNITTQNACSANEYYSKQIQDLSNQSQTTSAKYNHSLIIYNRELLRTVNYLAGIGALGVYMYFNRSK